MNGESREEFERDRFGTAGPLRTVEERIQAWREDFRAGDDRAAALLSEAENELVRLRAALALVKLIAQEAHREWDADNDSRVGKILMALAGYRKGYRADIDRIHAALQGGGR